jgi:hypothetical protein
MSDTTSVTPYRLGMGTDVARQLQDFSYMDEESASVYGPYGTTLLVAPMTVFFRRYPDSLKPVHTHRVTALTLDFNAFPVAQRPQSTIEKVWAWLINQNYGLKSYGWADLTLNQQQRLIRSSLLPIEMKSTQKMLGISADDFQIVMSLQVAGLFS